MYTPTDRLMVLVPRRSLQIAAPRFPFRVPHLPSGSTLSLSQDSSKRARSVKLEAELNSPRILLWHRVFHTRPRQGTGGCFDPGCAGNVGSAHSGERTLAVVLVRFPDEFRNTVN